MTNLPYAVADEQQTGAAPQPVRLPAPCDGVGSALRKAYASELPPHVSEWERLLANIR